MWIFDIFRTNYLHIADMFVMKVQQTIGSIRSRMDIITLTMRHTNPKSTYFIEFRFVSNKFRSHYLISVHLLRAVMKGFGKKPCS